MYYLYVLKSVGHPRHYIGTCENVGQRLAKHNSGSVRSTKAYRPWQILHIEEFSDKKSARQREIFLKKTAKARTELFAKLEKF